MSAPLDYSGPDTPGARRSGWALASLMLAALAVAPFALACRAAVHAHRRPDHYYPSLMCGVFCVFVVAGAVPGTICAGLALRRAAHDVAVSYCWPSS